MKQFNFFEHMADVEKMIASKPVIAGVDFSKKEDSHEQKTIAWYAHDYRDMKMSEPDLADMLTGFSEALQCDHQCSSNCRREGCNCACGEYHY